MSLRIINQARNLSKKDFQQWVIEKKLKIDGNNILNNILYYRQNYKDEIIYNNVIRLSFFGILGINTIPELGYLGILINTPILYTEYTTLSNLNYILKNNQKIYNQKENER